MPTKRPPRDTNQLAKYILEVTTGETEKIEPPVKNAAAQALSKLGASKGGKARAERLSATKRKAIAKSRSLAMGKTSLALIPPTKRNQNPLIRF